MKPQEGTIPTGAEFNNRLRSVFSDNPLNDSQLAEFGAEPLTKLEPRVFVLFAGSVVAHRRNALEQSEDRKLRLACHKHLAVDDGRDRESNGSAKLIATPGLAAVVEFFGNIRCIVSMQYVYARRFYDPHNAIA